MSRPKTMGIFRDPLQAYGKAHRLIWKMGGWRYLLIPILVSAMLAPLLIAGCYFVSELVAGWGLGWFGKPPGEGGWLRTLAHWTLFLAALLPGYALFRILVMLVYGPFLDRLSVKAEVLLHQGKTEAPSPPVPDGSIIRMVFVNLFCLGLSFILLLSGFVTGWIPFVGAFVGVVILFPLQMFLGGYPYLDPSLERAGHRIPGSIALALRHFGKVVVFSSLGFLLLTIPVVGWFLGPTYAVVAGIVLGVGMRETKD